MSYTGYIMFGVIIGFFYIILFSVLSVIIINIRKDYPSSVFTLWYLFSLFFCVFTMLFFYIDFAAVNVENDSSVVLKFAISGLSVSTDFYGEVILVAAMLWVSIFPQILSYILSGIFGCGQPPSLVVSITRYSLLSFSKLFCASAGAYFAGSCTLYITPHLFDTFKVPLGMFSGLGNEVDEMSKSPTFMATIALVNIICSFGLLQLYHSDQVKLASMPRFVILLHNYMSRHRGLLETAAGGMMGEEHGKPSIPAGS